MDKRLDELKTVEKCQVYDFDDLVNTDIVRNTQGLSEKLVLTRDDIGHLYLNGTIVVPINGMEYCLVIVYDEL